MKIVVALFYHLIKKAMFKTLKMRFKQKTHNNLLLNQIVTILNKEKQFCHAKQIKK